MPKNVEKCQNHCTLVVMRYLLTIFPNLWVRRVAGIGCYAQKCRKMPKSLHLSGYALFVKRHTFFLYIAIGG
jgi:hypothetical protein